MEDFELKDLAAMSDGQVAQARENSAYVGSKTAWFLYAARHNDTVAAADALACGVPIDWMSSERETALHHASYYDAPEVVAFLIERGANVNVVNGNGATPLHFACQENHRHLEIAKMLIKAGADTKALDDFDEPPHHETLDAALRSIRSEEMAQRLDNVLGDVPCDESSTKPSSGFTL
jgi:ankyrin repeat protein